MRNEKGQFVRINSLVKGDCRVCGEEFIRESWRKGQLLCSTKCRALVKDGVRLKNWVQLICKSCGNQFEVTPAREGVAIYCSWECKAQNTPVSGFWQGKERLNMIGVNNPAWRGGISFNPYPKEFNKELKLKIRIRDNFTCCLCGKTEREELEDFNRVLSVNHIDFDKKNCNEVNLNTLCQRCNVKINRAREYWTDYFKQ